MSEVKVGDNYILHSENGFDYKMTIINVNELREPNKIYAFDMWDLEGRPVSNDVSFCGADFLSKCERISE